MRSPIELEPFSDEGFYRTVEPEVARRQFNMSLGLLTLLTMVAVALGATAGFSPIAHSSFSDRQARLVVQSPQRVHVLQASEAQSPRG
jgi:hypothetical protein